MTEVCTNYLVDWQNSIHQAFEDAPESLCDLMQRIATVVIGIFLVYPALALINLFSRISSSSVAVTAEKMEQIKKDLLNNISNELLLWDRCLENHGKPPATLFLKIGISNKELNRAKVPMDVNTQSQRSEFFAFLRAEVKRQIEELPLGPKPTWEASLFIVHKRNDGHYNLFTRTKGIDSSGTSNATGITKVGVDKLLIQSFNLTVEDI